MIQIQMLLQSSKKILLIALFVLAFSLIWEVFIIPVSPIKAQTEARTCATGSRIECSDNPSVNSGCTLQPNRAGTCQPISSDVNSATPRCYCLPDSDSSSIDTNNGSSSSNNSDPLDIDNSIGLDPIKIPFFPQVNLPTNEYSTFLSWASFIGGLFSIGLVIFWVFLILRASFTMLKSEGNEEMVADSISRLKSVFIGAALSIIFPIGLSVIGGILGLGNLWAWPAAFRNCPGTDSNYYYQEVLKVSNAGVANPKEQAELNCF